MRITMRITIKTLQREFVTDPDHWLGSSRYFDNLFSGKWGDKQGDGSYSIETDADTFENILRYLRTNVLPLFYDIEKGHDHALYYSLLSEAKYFGIDRLEKWIIEKKYLDVVKITHEGVEYTNPESIPTHWRKSSSEWIPAQFSLTPMKRKGQAYYCPAGDAGHGSPWFCDNCVSGVKNLNAGYKDKDTIVWCMSRTLVQFDYKLCVNA